MGSSRGTQNGPDAVDVACVLEAFQHINRCKLDIVLTVDSTGKVCVLEMKVRAWDTLEDVPGAKLLASQKSRLGFHSPQTMEAAILSALYRLDAKFAEIEFAKVDNK